MQVQVQTVYNYRFKPLNLYLIIVHMHKYKVQIQTVYNYRFKPNSDSNFILVNMHKYKVQVPAVYNYTYTNHAQVQVQVQTMYKIKHIGRAIKAVHQNIQVQLLKHSLVYRYVCKPYKRIKVHLQTVYNFTDHLQILYKHKVAFTNHVYWYRYKQCTITDSNH